jgi:16S rRNA (guanine(1405)-N(7))-methyltransferase
MARRTFNCPDAARRELGAKAKFADLAPATIADVVQREYTRHGPGRPAFDAARKRLHRIRADYLGPLPAEAQLARLEAAVGAGDDAAAEATCLDLLDGHDSTRERLDVLAAFYRELWRIAGRPDSVQDLACAVHPFAWRWMGLPAQTRYLAYDNVRGFARAAERYLRAEGVAVAASWQDILVAPPSERADLAFFFKMYHCLEARRRGAGAELLQAVPARRVAVTLPTRNLGGRSRDIAGQHTPAIRETALAHRWSVTEAAFPNELLLVVDKHGGDA